MGIIPELKQAYASVAPFSVKIPVPLAIIAILEEVRWKENAWYLVAVRGLPGDRHTGPGAIWTSLKGSWSGEWRENATTEHRILLEFKWEGKYGVNPEGGTLTGTLNPGPTPRP